LSPPFGPYAVACTGLSDCAGWEGGADGAAVWLAFGAGEGAEWLAFAAGPDWPWPPLWLVAAWLPAADGAAGRAPASTGSAIDPSATTMSARHTNTAQRAVGGADPAPAALRA